MGKSARNASTNDASDNVKRAPAWPALRQPHLPLSLTELLHDQVLICPAFFDAKSRSRWCCFFDSLVFEPAARPKKGEAARSNSRIVLDDVGFAARFYEETGLRDLLAGHPDLFEDAVGLNPRWRLYRYRPGQAFAKHYDESVVDSLGRRTRWTLLLYLTGREDGVKGGETAFYPEATGKARADPVIAPLQAGTLLLHRHGDACLLHEGVPVESGADKLVLRTDISFLP